MKNAEDSAQRESFCGHTKATHLRQPFGCRWFRKARPPLPLLRSVDPYSNRYFGIDTFVQWTRSRALA
jgi:hypothetical protein